MATDEARNRCITKLAFKAPEEMVDDVRTQVTYLPDRLFEPHYAYKKAILAPNICALSFCVTTVLFLHSEFRSSESNLSAKLPSDSNIHALETFPPSVCGLDIRREACGKRTLV